MDPIMANVGVRSLATPSWRGVDACATAVSSYSLDQCNTACNKQAWDGRVIECMRMTNTTFQYYYKRYKGKGRYSSSWEPHLRATGRHLPYGITQCLSVTCHPTQVNAPRLTPAMQAGTRFTYPGGMKGWVDLVDLIAPRLEVVPATFRSRVQRPTNTTTKTTIQCKHECRRYRQ